MNSETLGYPATSECLCTPETSAMPKRLCYLGLTVSSCSCWPGAPGTCYISLTSGTRKGWEEPGDQMLRSVKPRRRTLSTILGHRALGSFPGGQHSHTPLPGQVALPVLTPRWGGGGGTAGNFCPVTPGPSVSFPFADFHRNKPEP